MRMNKIIMFMFMLLGVVSGVSGALNTDLMFGSHYDNGTSTDWSVNGNNGVVSGAIATTDKNNIANKALLFDGGNDIVTVSGLNTIDSLSIWFKPDSTITTSTEVGLASFVPSIKQGFRLGAVTGNAANEMILISDGGNSNFWYWDSSIIPNFSASTWYNLIFVWESTNYRVYLDGVDKGLATIFGSPNQLTETTFGIGRYSSLFFDGKIDEPRMWNRELSSSEALEVFDLYDLEDFTPVLVLTFTNITANNITLINNTFYNDSILFKTTVLNTSTNGNVNHSYSLNGTSFIQYATDSLTGSVNLNLSEGFYEISFKAENNETNVTSSNFSFIVDRTPPSIVIIGNLSTDQFQVNFSNVVNVTDNLSGLASCIIVATYLENVTNASQFDRTVNCTDTVTFEAAGLYNGFATAIDNAGNVATLSANGTIEPFVSINFLNQSADNITNYNAIITHPSGFIETFTNVNNPLQLFPFFNGSLDLGVYNIEFSKLGFSTELFNVSINVSSGGTEINFTVTESVIIIRIFDRETGALLTGLTSIIIQATTGFSGNTTTGLLNVSNINFINEQYQILAEHADYDTETVYFNYNNQETINVDIFMLNTSSTGAGQITIIVKNSLSQFVESAVCSALEWRPSESAFVSVAQGLSNVVGETRLNIQLNTVIYKFSCTKDAFTTITNAQIIQIDGSSLNIILNDVILAPTTLFLNLVTSMTNTTINATHQLITYNFADADGLTTQACLRVFLVNGNRQTNEAENCVSSSTGTLLITVDSNQSSNILIQGTLTTSEVTDFVTNSITIQGIGDLAGQLSKIGLDVLIPTILILLGLGLGILLAKIEISAILIAIAGWVSVAFVPTILKSSIAMFITVVVVMMLWGGFNRK